MKLSKIMMGTAAVMMAFSMLLCSCQSTKASDETVVQGDADYSDAPVVAEEVIDAEDKTDDSDVEAGDEADIDEETADNEESDNQDVYIYTEDSAKPKPKKNALLAFFTNEGNSKFTDAGSFTLSTATMGTKIKQQDGSFLIDKASFDAGFGSNIMSAYYIVLMDQKTRDIYNHAVNSYLNDFENKKLNRKDKKAMRKYGKSKVSIYWGLLKDSTTNNGVADAYFGYTFKDKSPYFTITVYPTVNQKRYSDEMAPEQSMTLNYYFTKAQSRELADFLKEETLRQLLNEDIPNVEIIDSDSY